VRVPNFSPLTLTLSRQGRENMSSCIVSEIRRNVPCLTCDFHLSRLPKLSPITSSICIDENFVLTIVEKLEQGSIELLRTFILWPMARLVDEDES
jgi:hypothetical protein